MDYFSMSRLRVPLCLCFKTSLCAKSYENEFDLHGNEHVGGTHLVFDSDATGNSEIAH